MSAANFGDRLAEACAAKGGPVCVGLDPRFEDLPEAFRKGRGEDLESRAEALLRFTREVIGVGAPLVPVG